MSTKLEEWSILEGKTLLHIEALNGRPILSMAKKRRGEAVLIEQLPRLLNALFAWRSAEVHASALLLGMREGDKAAAAQAVEDRSRELRILADQLHQKAIFRPA
jgi:hypothetical protein